MSCVHRRPHPTFTHRSRPTLTCHLCLTHNHLSPHTASSSPSANLSASLSTCISCAHAFCTYCSPHRFRLLWSCWACEQLNDLPRKTCFRCHWNRDWGGCVWDWWNVTLRRWKDGVLREGTVTRTGVASDKGMTFGGRSVWVDGKKLEREKWGGEE
ncbi:hypothetical protein EX30DRAFT_344806 [Ascodesmis nigricans]|uniref:RanBP2-type domain-containing protein n=1 Tax=Ascodesmis nigricans TaxID=341454 RepID=A0A4S2MI17_9PEZI|nr:hypothetical protein EX30DRAFT_344806 [Ascodesmis nigricans]